MGEKRNDITCDLPRTRRAARLRIALVIIRQPCKNMPFLPPPWEHRRVASCARVSSGRVCLSRFFPALSAARDVYPGG